MQQVKKYRIDYTTGMLDVFHIGLLTILKYAKEPCDCFIAKMSADEVAQSSTHNTLVISFVERCPIISSVASIDQVATQTVINKLETWRSSLFNAGLFYRKALG